MGLAVGQGVLLTEPFYWDQDDQTRAWSKRFEERAGHKPTAIQAGAYSEVSHYLKAVKAAGSKDADKVMAKMREIPINDFMTHDGKLRTTAASSATCISSRLRRRRNPRARTTYTS